MTKVLTASQHFCGKTKLWAGRYVWQKLLRNNQLKQIYTCHARSKEIPNLNISVPFCRPFCVSLKVQIRYLPAEQYAPYTHTHVPQ